MILCLLFGSGGEENLPPPTPHSSVYSAVAPLSFALHFKGDGVVAMGRRGGEKSTSVSVLVWADTYLHPAPCVTHHIVKIAVVVLCMLYM